MSSSVVRPSSSVGCPSISMEASGGGGVGGGGGALDAVLKKWAQTAAGAMAASRSSVSMAVAVGGEGVGVGMGGGDAVMFCGRAGG